MIGAWLLLLHHGGPVAYAPDPWWVEALPMMAGVLASAIVGWQQRKAERAK